MRRKTAAAPMALVTIAAILPALAACQPQAPDGSRAKPPADAPATPQAKIEDPPVPPAFRGDFDARGTEPFWAARIRAESITIMQPQTAPVTAPNNGPRMAGPQAVWASLAGEEPVVVAILEQDCSDGMSDRVYPYAAELQLGELSFTGCAEKASG